MKSNSTDALLKTAIQAAQASGEVLRKHFTKKLKVTEKAGSLGLVTNADLEAEEVALKILSGKFPHFGVIAEESNPKEYLDLSKTWAGRWIIDPLDGTTNFVHRFPMFCVSIAAEVNGKIVVGVIYHPILDEMLIAVRGKGARVDGKRVHVSQTAKLTNSLLTTGFTYQKQKLLHHEMRAFEKLSQVARAVRRPGSAALDLAYTGRGVFDGFWERNLSPWDVAAGALIVEEAGGKITDFKGNPFAIHQREIVASNGRIHAELLKLIAAKKT